MSTEDADRHEQLGTAEIVEQQSHRPAKSTTRSTLVPEVEPDVLDAACSVFWA